MLQGVAMRKMLFGVTVFLLSVGVVLAAEFNCTIIKVDGSKVTVKKGKKGEEKEYTYTAAKDVKVNKGTFDAKAKKLEIGDAIDGGLKNELFTKIGEKGVGARVITEGEGDKETITQIVLTKKKGKGAGGE